MATREQALVAVAKLEAGTDAAALQVHHTDYAGIASALVVPECLAGKVFVSCRYIRIESMPLPSESYCREHP
jgi:hypothetical protein